MKQMILYCIIIFNLIIIIDQSLEAKPRVAVLDTGCSLEEVQGVSFTRTSPFDDSCGHGTLMSKVVLATNPDTELVMVKVSDYRNSFDPHTVSRGLRWCLENDIDIVNMSFTMSENSEVKDSINLLLENNITVIAAVGNVSQSSGFVIGDDNLIYKASDVLTGEGFPANMENVVSVGAMNFFGYKANFARSTGEISVDGNWGSKKGTSISTAKLSGYISILIERYPNLTNNQIRSLMHQMASKKRNNRLLSKNIIIKSLKTDLTAYLKSDDESAYKS